jgi:hypothetical protein
MQSKVIGAWALESFLIENPQSDGNRSIAIGGMATAGLSLVSKNQKAHAVLCMSLN